MSSHSNAAGKPALITVAAARERLLDGLLPVKGIETVDLLQARGRVLAEAALAACDVPPADNSAMDGYAFRAADYQRLGGLLTLSGRIQAGDQPAALKAGTAVRIFTGAVMPKGADAVAMQEVCSVDADQVRIEGRFEAGANVRRAGEDIATGEIVVESGRRLRPQEMGLLASTGIDRVSVRRRLKVAVLATGDELVEPGQPLQPGQIYNSNASMLAGLLDQLGCELTQCAPVADTVEATRDALTTAADQADLVVTSGGVSVGEADHVRAVIESLGELALWKIAVKPGKPLAFGRIHETPIIGLPGNPVAVFVTVCLFAAPLIRKLQGRADLLPGPLSVASAFAARAGSREEYLRVRLIDGCLQPYPHQGSGVLSSVAWADGLARVPVDVAIEPGQMLEYFPMHSLLD